MLSTSSQNPVNFPRQVVKSVAKALSAKAEVISKDPLYGECIAVSIQSNVSIPYGRRKKPVFLLFYNSSNRYISKLPCVMALSVEMLNGKQGIFQQQFAYTKGLTLVLSYSQFKHVRVSKKVAVSIQITFTYAAKLASDYNSLRVEPGFVEKDGKKELAELSFVPGTDIVEDKPVFTARPIGEKKEEEALQEKSDGLFAGVDIGSDKREEPVEEYDRQDEEDTHEDCEHVASIRTSGSMFGGGSSLILLNQESTKKFRGELYHCKHCPEYGESLTN